MYYLLTSVKFIIGGFVACIIKKTKNNRVYYYAAESARVNGKPPRIVWQKYIGTLDDILKRAQEGSQCGVSEVDIFEAGGIAAMLKIVNQIDLINIINEVVPKRDQGPSVGEYIVLAMLNRVLDPCSKADMPDWYKKTALYRLWKHNPEAFTSQRFWDHMNFFTDEHIEEIQIRVAKKIKTSFSINLETVLYDTTNFFTYIATRNHRNTLARRGKNKAKRNDLRQVGLALLVTKDFQIPLFHNVYQGNLPDRGIFSKMSKKIQEQFCAVFGKNESTMVFDKGNISDDGMENILFAGQHFVCAVPKNTLSELFRTPLDEFKMVEGLSGTKALVTEVEVWNCKLKCVIAYAESYFCARAADFTDIISKCTAKLNDLSKSLSKHTQKTAKVSRCSQASVNTKVKNILSGDRLKEVFTVNVSEKDGVPCLSYDVNHEKLQHIMTHEFGRTMLLTTRLNWDEKAIISAYRDQNLIEEVMKKMKNREYLHWQPEFHWTDQKIKVHGLYCVLALLIATLAHKIAVENGLAISLLEMLDALSGIKEVALIYDKKRKKEQKDQIVLSKMSNNQKRLAEIFDIASILKG